MREHSEEVIEAASAIYAMRHHTHKDRTRVKGTNYSAKETKERMDAVMAQRELNSINNDDLMPSLNLTKTDTRYQSELQRKRAKENGKKGNFGKFYGVSEK